MRFTRDRSKRRHRYYSGDFHQARPPRSCSAGAAASSACFFATATAYDVGGALQLFFGLRGLRWKREIAPYESDAWACPERPKWDTSGMENYGLGPYWCPPAKN